MGPDESMRVSHSRNKALAELDSVLDTMPDHTIMEISTEANNAMDEAEEHQQTVAWCAASLISIGISEYMLRRMERRRLEETL